MATVDPSAATDAFAAANSDLQTRRAQIAQFALLRAATHMSNNDQDGAIKELKNTLAFDPQNETAHTYLGQIYQSQGKIPEAVKELTQVILTDRTSATAHNNLGNAYLQDKQYDNAEKEYKLASGLDPTNPVADYTLGNLYTQTARYTEAEAQFAKVAKISPQDANVPYSLGVLYNKMERPKDAALQLTKALTLKTDFAAANYELGVSYIKMGDTDNADKQLVILSTKDTGLASDLQYLRDTPQIAYMEDTNNENFNSGLGARTPIWMLDPTHLSTPNASIRVGVAIQFTNDMDAASVMNPSNWEISRANTTEGGYYNSSLPPTGNEVNIPKRPFSISYDPLTRQAKVYFILNQNGSVDIGNGNQGATIDPAHLVFKFSGVDAAGRQMDTSGDQIDGWSIRAY
jgi:Tfp pilus assembly protein PilF